MQDHQAILDTSSDTGTVHAAAVRMQEHFVQTGTYLAQDVAKVIGDPRDSVTCEVVQDYSGTTLHPAMRSLTVSVAIDG